MTCDECEGRGVQVIPAHMLAGHEQRRVCPRCGGSGLQKVWIVTCEVLNNEMDEWTEIVAVCASEEAAERERDRVEATPDAPNVVSREFSIDDYEVSA